MAENMVVEPPMPSATARMAIMLKPGVFSEHPRGVAEVAHHRVAQLPACPGRKMETAS